MGDQNAVEMKDGNFGTGKRVDYFELKLACNLSYAFDVANPIDCLDLSDLPAFALTLTLSWAPNNAKIVLPNRLQELTLVQRQRTSVLQLLGDDLELRVLVCDGIEISPASSIGHSIEAYSFCVNCIPAFNILLTWPRLKSVTHLSHALGMPGKMTSGEKAQRLVHVHYARELYMCPFRKAIILTIANEVETFHYLHSV